MTIAIRSLLSVLFHGLVCLVLLPHDACAAVDLYCGQKNCYEILGVTPQATSGEIKKSFYKLSLQYHPDKNSSPDAVDLYREITTAYEVLGDPEARKNYDEALEHPERFFQNQYKYYQYQYKHAQKIDAWKLLLITLIVVSFGHYYYWRHRYFKLRVMIATAPAVVARMRAKVKTDLMAEKIQAGIKNPSVSKDEIDVAVTKEDVSKYAELTSWEGRHPTLYDTIPVWLVLIPYRLTKFLYWHARFIILFTIMKKPYGPEEADYATSQALGMDYNKWLGAVPEDQRVELASRSLWIPKNLEKWKREMMASKKKTW